MNNDIKTNIVLLNHIRIFMEGILRLSGKIIFGLSLFHSKMQDCKLFLQGTSKIEHERAQLRNAILSFQLHFCGKEILADSTLKEAWERTYRGGYSESRESSRWY